MAVDLHISGPGIDDRRVLQAGQAELVLGRDADCHICLPDPRRNVSRRHLAVWCDADELHFRVLSVVNGVELPFGEAPPGACGVLPHGQLLKLGDYKVLGALASADPAQDDPGAVFDRDASGFGSSAVSDEGMTQPAEQAALQPPAEDDPFGEWGFDSTFGPGSRAGGPLQAGGAVPPGGEMTAFLRGVGLDPDRIGALGEGELEEMGRLVRLALLGLLELHASKAELKRDLRAEDRTMVAVKDNNPLKADWPDDTRLQYLLGGRAASIGFIRPERALGELLVELRAHDQAMSVAARAVVEGTLRELSPDELKKHLPGAGSRLFGSARLWDAYEKYHQQQGADMPRWLQRLLGKYFTEAYLRESMRIKRDPATRPK
jgi:predicted component of type VI protein secretion system